MTALAVLYSLPVVLLAIVLQRRIVAGLTPAPSRAEALPTPITRGHQ